MKKVKNEAASIRPVDKPKQLASSELNALLVETSSFIRATEARSRYEVSGKNLTVAVLDTGLRSSHVDFRSKVATEVNFTTDNGGAANKAADGNGHGTNVSGIIVANKLNIGIAPGASIVPIKVLTNTGGGNFSNVDKALRWVINNYAQYRISAVNLSLGDSGNYQSDAAFATNAIKKSIAQLTQAGVAVVIAAGNDFYAGNSAQGMGFPGIIRECISVGAVYDAVGGGYNYGGGAAAFSTKPGQITPFSQRLHDTVGGIYRTDIFAPGAPITSSGIASDTAYSVQQGTSQAAPVTTGVILLMQELYQKMRGTLPNGQALPVLPPVNLLVEWLRNGAVDILDGDDELDNVANTGLSFKRIDAYQALRQVRKYFVGTLAFSA